ncbi:MAG: VIT1/CCC1 transporter family protein, partial [Chloroflexi bacterium]|nr:VIT1/CCC1 transporter family protein [Chloroflexota bacterium]
MTSRPSAQPPGSQQEAGAPGTDGPPTPEQLNRYRRYLQAEWEAAALYRRLADAEPAPERAAVLRELAAMEDTHAARWRGRLEAAGETLPGWKPSARSGLLAWLARRLGTRAVLPILERFEGGDADMYAAEPEAPDFSLQERSHGGILGRLMGKGVASTIARRERRHRGVGSGSLRAAVFGMNDGLVSNLSLVMGVAGADPGSGFVLLAGLAGLLAGAFSMAAGEYISMRTQREMLERELEIEA